MKTLIGKVVCLLVMLMSSCTSTSGEKDAELNVVSEPKYEIHTVEISRMAFQPAEIIVKKGDRINFVNLDLVAHNVTEEADKGWSSSLLNTEETWTLEVTNSVNYYCSLHPVMKGKIIVQ